MLNVLSGLYVLRRQLLKTADDDDDDDDDANHTLCFTLFIQTSA